MHVQRCILSELRVESKLSRCHSDYRQMGNHQPVFSFVSLCFHPQFGSLEGLEKNNELHCINYFHQSRSISEFAVTFLLSHHFSLSLEDSNWQQSSWTTQNAQKHFHWHAKKYLMYCKCSSKLMIWSPADLPRSTELYLRSFWTLPANCHRTTPEWPPTPMRSQPAGISSPSTDDRRTTSYWMSPKWQNSWGTSAGTSRRTTIHTFSTGASQASLATPI